MIALNTKEFEGALKEAKKYYDAKSTLTILANVHLYNMGDTLFIDSTNLEFFYHTSMQVRSELNIEIDTCIDLATLLKMVNQFDKEMTITNDGDEKYTFKSGKKGSTITGISKDEFPPMPVFDITASNFVDHAEFSKAWSNIKPCLHVDSQHPRPMLEIAHISHDMMEGTDGFRIHQYNFSKPLGLSEFMLHPQLGDAAKLLSPDLFIIELGEKVTNDNTTNYIRFTDNTTSVTWMIYPEYEGNYPDTSVIFPKKIKDNYKCNVKDLLDGLDYLVKNRAANWVVRYNGEYKRLEQKSCDDVVSYDFDLGDLWFAVNVRFFWEAVKYQYEGCEFVNIGINANNTPIVFTNDDHTARTILMPMHLPDDY